MLLPVFLQQTPLQHVACSGILLQGLPPCEGAVTMAEDRKLFFCRGSGERCGV